MARSKGRKREGGRRAHLLRDIVALMYVLDGHHKAVPAHEGDFTGTAALALGLGDFPALRQQRWAEDHGVRVTLGWQRPGHVIQAPARPID